LSNLYTDINKSGFTIIELMIVVGIAAVLAGIAGGAFIATMPKYMLKKDASELSANFKKARSLAIKFNRDVSIVFMPANKKYIIDGGPPVELDSRVSFGAPSGISSATGSGSPPTSGITFAENTVTFNLRGFPSIVAENAVYLKNSKGDAKAVCLNPAGNVTVKQWSGAWQ
jgi:prepilin-type N-terminal cleavage/methylation domain-containing protein